MGNSQSEKESDNETMASRGIWCEATSAAKSATRLHFHQVCGNNISLINNNTVAFRHHSFNYGLTFTDRPLSKAEPIFLRIRDTSTNWSGAIRIGFTANDPSAMDKAKLPAHSCPDFAALPGNWAKALPESLNKNDSTLSYYVDSGGNVYYKLDKDTENFLMSGIDTSRKLWGVVDVYGNTMSVELVLDPEKEEYLELEPPFENSPSKCELAFHEVHGLTTVLSRKNTVARRKGIHSSYVFSGSPMKLEEKIVIRINGIDPAMSGPLEYGITACDPSTLKAENLPTNTEDLLDWQDYWILKRDSCNYRCKDLLLFSIESDGRFVVRKNGASKSTVLYVDSSLTLWLYIKMSGSVDEICMLGSVKSASLDTLTHEFLNLSFSCTKGSHKDKHKLDEEGESSCVICHDKPRNCILYKCGHLCMCYDCAQVFWKPNSGALCPICREVIQDVMKVYT